MRRHLRRRNATHRHDHRRMERAGRTALDRRVVHRHVAACRDVPHRHARLHHFQQRAGFGIALREQQKIECLLLGQNHQIRLRVALRDAAGRADQAVTERGARLFGRARRASSVVPISDIPSTIALAFPVAAVRPFSERTADELRNPIPQKRTSESLSLTLVANVTGAGAIHDAYVSAFANWRCQVETNHG